jgi:hypothetical protein
MPNTDGLHGKLAIYLDGIFGFGTKFDGLAGHGVSTFVNSDIT